jgi:hypothetical protein
MAAGEMMLVNGRDCSIVIKTAFGEMERFGGAEVPVPYSEETLREAVSLLIEEAAIEGDGRCRAIKKSGGVTGCVVTPLTIGTAPLLLYLAMGSVGLPLFVSETRNVYLYQLSLVPMEGGACFDVVQDRGGVRRLFENCRAKGFEMRCNRGETVRLKLDICGDRAPAIYPYAEIPATGTGLEDFSPCGGNQLAPRHAALPEKYAHRFACGYWAKERFSGDYVTYRINGQEYKNIYGLTLSAKREGGTRTELWIKRALQQGGDLPGIIEELIITAQLLFDKYEHRCFGMFRITVKRLVLTSDETAVDCADGVIGPIRYYAAGTVMAEVFTNKE